MNDKLTARQKLFVQEYLVDLNGRQAAIRAKYSPNCADIQACANLGLPKIQAAIKAGMSERAKATGITQERVVLELAIVAFSDLQDFIVIDKDTGAIRAKGFEEMPPTASRALSAINEDRAIKESSDGKEVVIFDKVNFKMHDKLRALELLGKHLGMFKEGGPALTIDNHLTIEVIKTR